MHCHLLFSKILKNNKKTRKPRVLFLPQVYCVLGNFLLKLLLVEAYGIKVHQVCYEEVMPSRMKATLLMLESNGRCFEFL
jgi:hypothetical protein